MIFENLNAFRKTDVKYDEIWLVNRKYFMEVEASLLEVALNLSGLCEYWVEFEEKRVWKPILLWLYCKNREPFVEKFRKKFNLKKDPHNLAEIFIRIYLEH